MEIKEIKKILLKEYYKLVEVFSKKKLDKLPPYRPKINYDIMFEAEVISRYCLFYKLLLEELKVVKKYILKNL